MTREEQDEARGLSDDAIAVLTGGTPKSYCNGSDECDRLGLTNADGSLTSRGIRFSGWVDVGQ